MRRDRPADRRGYRIAAALPAEFASAIIGMASSAPAAMVGLTFAGLTQTPRESAVRPHRHGAGRR